MKIEAKLFLVLAIVSVGFFVGFNQVAADNTQRVLTCLGDSVTHGYPYVGTDKTYPARLQVNLDNQYGSGKYDVSNRGVSGYRADQVLGALQSEGWLASDNPDAVLLMVGGNDLAQGQSISSTVAEVQQIVDYINAHTNTNGTTPQILLSAFIPNNLYGSLGSAAINLYNNTLQSDVTGVDLWFTDNWTDFYDTSTGAAKTDLMADDTHPNENGYILMAENWLAAVNTKISAPTGGGDDGNGSGEGDTDEITTEDGRKLNPHIVVSSGPREVSRLQVYTRYGYPVTVEISDIFPEGYLGGVGVVAIDANENGVKDQIVIFATSEAGPQARVFGIKDDASLVFKGQMFLFDSSIRDGLSVTVGDFDDDGFADDVAGCLVGNQTPTVRVYKDANGVDDWSKIGEFSAPFGQVGCNVGTFQYDDKADEILVAPHHGPSAPNVYIYTVGGTLKKEFRAYGAGVTNGLTPSGIAERIYTTPNKGSSHVMSFDKNGDRKNFWWAYQQHIRGDFKNVAGDIDVDGKDEILISPIGANGPQVLAFEPDGHWRTWPNFFAFGDMTLRNGVGVAVIENWHGKN